jgi:hypothetical protein
MGLIEEERQEENSRKIICWIEELVGLPTMTVKSACGNPMAPMLIATGMNERKFSLQMRCVAISTILD